MNNIYITALIISAVFLLFTIINADEWWSHRASDAKGITAFVLFMVTAILPIVGFIPGIGNSNESVKNAYSQKMGNEIIVQVDGWKTQIVTDLKFVDVPLQIKRIEKLNAYGMGGEYSYEVQVNNPNPVIKTER